MKNSLRILLILAMLFPAVLTLSGQNASKRGGVCFRVDDNPPLSKLHQLDSVFSAYQQHFSMAMTSWVFPLSPAYVDSLKVWIAKGHEVMDNSPTHQTQYFNLVNPADTALYMGDPGIDHYSGQRVCLKIAGIDTTQPHNEGPVNVFSNLVISQYPGEFGDLAGNPFYFALYLSTPVNRLCMWYDLRAKNPFDVDSVYVKSLWDEPVLLGTQWGVSYHKLTQRNVIMSQAAIRLLGQRSLDLFSSLGIPRPATWIHPAGPMPWISAYDLKWNMGDVLGYTAGSNFINYSYLCYNEYNPSGIAPFGMQSTNTSLETSTLAATRKLIANAVARHYVTIDISYLSNPAGGWNAFLQRTDSLLTWCQASDIPVRTYQEWKGLLYDSLPNRVVNIFPKLNTDLDGDNYPDGFDPNVMVSGVYDTTDGVAASGNRSFALPGSGNIFQVNALGGTEGGSNKFSVWTRTTGYDTAMVTFEFFFPERNITRTVTVAVDSTGWEPYSTLIDFPDSVTIMNITAYHYDTIQDTVKVSGMELKSSAFLKKSKLPEQEKTANLPFDNVNLNALVIDTLYAPPTITWSVTGQDTLNFRILEGNILKILKPQSFWEGKDSAYAVAQSPDGLKDSCFMAFRSLPIPMGCAGMPVTISLLDTCENDIVRWTSNPPDTSISNPNVYNPTVYPQVPTKYTAVVINPLGPVKTDSVFINRVPFPVPVLTNDTAICHGDSIDLVAGGGTYYLWNTGDTTSTIRVSPDTNTLYKVTISSEYDCSVSDSLVLTVSERPLVVLHGLLPAYCVTDWAATIYGTPAGGAYGATSGLVEQQFFPSLADTGMNYIWYKYSDATGCGDTDTVFLRVIPLPYIPPLPDTNLCAGNAIVLHAGAGSDNYLWSDGSTDSLLVVDSTGHGLGLYPVWVYVTKDGCVEKDTANIMFVECPIGFGEHGLALKVAVYPNPAGDEVFVNISDAPAEPLELTITDMAGQVVLTSRLGASNRINLDGLREGIYLLTVQGSGHQCTLRLVRRR